MKLTSKFYLTLAFIFLFAPIAVMLVFSFNDSKSLSVFSGFSVRWYQELFRDEETLTSVKNTLLLAASAALLSTVMGTAAALSINKLRRRWFRAAVDTVTNIPMINPDIITGISLMLLFVRFTELGTSTVLIAHITFDIPYVILNVLPKLSNTSSHTYEAARDLGATPLYAFFKIVWPDIKPGVFSGFLMAVTMSLDDFSITYFTKGAGVNTLSTMIYTQLRKGIIPEMYALSTILFFLALVLLLIMNYRSVKDAKGRS